MKKTIFLVTLILVCGIIFIGAMRTTIGNLEYRDCLREAEWTWSNLLEEGEITKEDIKVACCNAKGYFKEEIIGLCI